MIRIIKQASNNLDVLLLLAFNRYLLANRFSHQRIGRYCVRCRTLVESGRFEHLFPSRFLPSFFLFFLSPSFLGTAIVCSLPLDGLSAGSSLPSSPRSRTGYFETEDRFKKKITHRFQDGNTGSWNEEKIYRWAREIRF